MVKVKERHLKGVDMFKLIMAMSVVAIHTASADCVAGVWPLCVEWFIRLAVPFFFITSGYLVAARLPGGVSDRKFFLAKRSKKVLRMFFCWICIYLPISLYFYANNGQSFVHNLTRYIWQLIILGESKYAYPLWYLYSLAIVLAIYALASQMNKCEYKLFSLYALTMLIGWLGNSGLVDNIAVENLLDWFSLLTARTLGGGLYVMAGVILYKRNFSFDYSWIVGAILISVVLNYLSLPFWELFGGIAIFMIGYRFTSVSSVKAMKFRYASMWIYYLHMYVIFALVFICGKLDLTLSIGFCYLIVLTIVILIALCLLRLQKSKDFSWMKFLVS